MKNPSSEALWFMTENCMMKLLKGTSCDSGLCASDGGAETLGRAFVGSMHLCGVGKKWVALHIECG